MAVASVWSSVTMRTGAEMTRPRTRGDDEWAEAECRVGGEGGRDTPAPRGGVEGGVLADATDWEDPTDEADDDDDVLRCLLTVRRRRMEVKAVSEAMVVVVRV